MINRSSREAAAASGGWGLGESSATHQKKKKIKKKIQQRRRPGVCCHFLCRSVQPAAAAPLPTYPGEERGGGRRVGAMENISNVCERQP